MSGGGGFTSFMNSILRRNRKLLKNKRKFNERKQLYDVENLDDSNGFEMRETSEEEKTLARKLKRSEQEKSIIMYLLSTFLLISIAFNVYFVFFPSVIKEQKEPSRKRLESYYLDNMKIGDLILPSERWDAAIGNYRTAIKAAPDKFKGHQKLIFTLTKKCEKTKDYESCLEAKRHIGEIEFIFREQRNELRKYESEVWKVIDENFELKR